MNETLNGAKDDSASAQDLPLSETDQRARSDALVERLRDGDAQALAELFTLYQDRLLRLIDIRLDRNMHSRVDPVDVLHESYIDASQRVPHFLSQREASIYVWLRLIVIQRIQIAVRDHLLTSKRDARKEVAIGGDNGLRPFADIAQILSDSITSPSAAVARHEAVAMIEQILEEMPDADREVLMLRHFEQVPNEEVAEILGISIKAASNRYMRALVHLRTLAPVIDPEQTES